MNTTTTTNDQRKALESALAFVRHIRSGYIGRMSPEDQKYIRQHEKMLADALKK